MINNPRSSVYTSGVNYNGRADSTSSRIRAAFTGRSISSSSNHGDETDSVHENVFEPLEEVWQALDEWFLLLFNEMEEIGVKIEDCNEQDKGVHCGVGKHEFIVLTCIFRNCIHTVTRHMCHPQFVCHQLINNLFFYHFSFREIFCNPSHVATIISKKFILI